MNASRLAAGVERKRTVGLKAVNTALRMSYCKAILRKLAKDHHNLKPQLPASFFPTEDPREFMASYDQKKELGLNILNTGKSMVEALRISRVVGIVASIIKPYLTPEEGVYRQFDVTFKLDQGGVCYTAS